MGSAIVAWNWAGWSEVGMVCVRAWKGGGEQEEVGSEGRS